jgi:hypothetical protein
MKIIKTFALAFALFILMGTLASAKVSSWVVSFGQDFVVNGTAVKSGIYKLTYDDKTNELTITDRKTKSVVAKATGRLEKRQTSTGGMDVKMTDSGDTHVLTSLAFPGESNTIQLGGVSAAVSN